ncbi:MAG: endonuclease/exonuclease/phosphatase family protein [Vulcanimicrobiota bacterium]
MTWQKAATALLLGYAGGLCLIPVYFRLVPERHWVTVLPCYAPPLVWLAPLPLLAGLAWWLKVRPALIASALVLPLLLASGLQLSAPARPGSLRAISYNIQAGLGGPARLADYLLKHSPDIIALQEARTPIAPGHPDPVPILAERLVGYQLVRGGIRDELAIFTRLPVLEQKSHSLDGLSQALEATVEVNGSPLRVLDVHLMTGDPEGKLKGQASATQRLQLTADTRRRQIDALLTLLDDPVPTLLMGDFNTPPRSHHYWRLRSLAQDAFTHGTGWGLTYKSHLPLWRIDYAWLSPDLTVTGCWTASVKLSDHRPLLVEFQAGKESPIPAERDTP